MKKGTQGRKIYASLSLISKSLWKAFSENPKKRLHYQLSLFPPLIPRAFYTFLGNDEYRKPGRHIRHNHGSNKSGKHRNCLSTQRALFPLRQTMSQKLLSINPLSSFWVSSPIISGFHAITVSPSRTLQHSDFKARHTTKLFVCFSFPGSFINSYAHISAIVVVGTTIKEKSWFRFVRSCIQQDIYDVWG